MQALVNNHLFESKSRIKMNRTGFAWCSFALSFLILEGGIEMIAAQIRVDNGVMIKSNHKNIESHSSSSSSWPYSHMDHLAHVFFALEDLKVGRVMSIYFRRVDSSKSPHFLHRDEAELIPFSSSKLPFLLEYFGFARGSPQAKAMEDTVRQCEVKSIQGETKLCATSLESMLEFVGSMLMTEFVGLSTRHMTKLGANRSQNYTIVAEPRVLFAPKMVACHSMPYPYAVLYCHYQESESKVFQVKLRGGEDGIELVEAIAVCHMDTSHWGHGHVSFRVLGIKPGSSTVCHFFPADNMVWVPLYNKEGHDEMAKQM